MASGIVGAPYGGRIRYNTFTLNANSTLKLQCFRQHVYLIFTYGDAAGSSICGAWVVVSSRSAQSGRQIGTIISPSGISIASEADDKIVLTSTVSAAATITIISDGYTPVVVT